MHVVKTYTQQAIWDPADPSVRMREVFIGGYPRPYGSFYWKTTPGGAQLEGLRGLGFWSGIPSWAQTAMVGAAAVAAGYFGMKHFGPTVKQKLGLSGMRRRRG